MSYLKYVWKSRRRRVKLQPTLEATIYLVRDFLFGLAATEIAAELTSLSICEAVDNYV